MCQVSARYSVVSHYQLKVGENIKRVSPEVMKQWNVSKTVGGEYGSRF